MKRAFFSLIFSVFIFTVFGILSVNAEGNKCFPDYKNRVIEINIEMSDEVFDEIKKDPESKTMHEASVTIDGQRFDKIGIKVKGSSSLKRAISWGTYRFPFELKLDEFESGVNFNSANSIKLNNCVGDRILAEYNAYEICRSMDILCPDCSFAFVKINGEDWGLYLAVETVNKNFCKRHFGGVLEGSLYKSTTTEDGEKAIYSEWLGELETKITNDNNKTLLDTINGLKNNDYEKVLDTDTLLKYYAVSMAVGDTDSMLCRTSNFYLYCIDGKTIVIPWDLDNAFDGFWDTDWSVDGYVGNEQYDQNKLLGLVLQNEKYKNKYYEYLLEITDKFLNKDYINKNILSQLKLLEPYFGRETSLPDSLKDYLPRYYEMCKNGTVEITIPIIVQTRSEQIHGMINGEIKSFSVPDSIIKLKEEKKKLENEKEKIKIFIPLLTAVIIIFALVSGVIIYKRKIKK